MEKITHTCPPQDEESCPTCSFKTYQQLCVKALVNHQLSITDIADVVALIGVFVPSRRTEHMSSVFSDKALQSFIDAGEITPEEWDAVDFDDNLPMKALKVCSKLSYIWNAVDVDAFLTVIFIIALHSKQAGCNSTNSRWNEP
jgi:hypothetical protein